jgi:enterobactin synthetase component D
MSTIAIAPPLFPSTVVQVCIESPALARRHSTLAERKRAEHAHGRFCARKALETLQPDRAPSTIERAEDGAPRWPNGVIGSITHCDGLASAAVALTRDVEALGIDSERCLSAESAEHVSDVVATAAELRNALEVTRGDHALATTLIASAKESVFKALYPLVLLRFDFEDVELVSWSASAFAARLERPLAADWPAGAVVTGSFTFAVTHVHTGCLISRTRAPFRCS